jgi:tetratricopeptide (TPR) repeat protein
MRGRSPREPDPDAGGPPPDPDAGGPPPDHDAGGRADGSRDADADADAVDPDAGADDRESAYALLQRGHELAAGRHHAQAAVVLERAAALEPRKGSILEPLGRAYFMTGQLDRAIETFEALLAVDPSSHYGHYALGRALVRAGRLEEGRTHLRLAVALAPGSRLYRGGLNRLGGTPE